MASACQTVRKEGEEEGLRKDGGPGSTPRVSTKKAGQTFPTGSFID